MKGGSNHFGQKWGAFWVYWFPVVAYIGLIFFLSSQSHLPISPPNIPYGDKLCHGIEFAILGYLLMRAFRQGSRISQNTSLALAILIALLFGLSDEIHQSFVPFRQSDIFDLLADGLGAAVGAWGGVWIKNWFIARREGKDCT
ncbi:MAG: VanZ family protein [bacterium]|nr:VanZ family protein [bacterium]